jgi:carboxymethylenebutenolidase
MGGAITLRQTVDNAKIFSAASVFYGKVRYGTTGNSGAITPIALDYAADIGVPTAGSWGSRDTSILADDVRALDARLVQLKKPHDFFIYEDAGHAFFDDTRDSYVAPAASDAWTRTLAWFKRYLA